MKTTLLKNTNQILKKARLRYNSSAWLKRADSFKLFLEKHQQELAKLPEYARHYQDLMGQMITEERYANLRAHSYSEWLKTAASLMYLEGDSKALTNVTLRLMVSLDYKKFYEALLFEFHYYLSRSCFCKLALHYKANLNPRTLRFELEYLVNHLHSLFKENRDIYKNKEFIDLFIHAYRSAMMDLCLYHDMNLNIMSNPIFYLNDLMNDKTLIEPDQSNTKPAANQPNLKQH